MGVKEEVPKVKIWKTGDQSTAVGYQ